MNPAWQSGVGLGIAPANLVPLLAKSIAAD